MITLIVLFYADAAPVAKQLADEAVEASDATSARLEVRFNMAVTYGWHFPEPTRMCL